MKKTTEQATQKPDKKVIKNRVAFLDKQVPFYTPFVGIAGILLLWELIARIGFVSPLFLPAPSVIVMTGWEMLVMSTVKF